MNNLYSVIKDESDYETQRINILRRIDKEYLILKVKKALSRYDFIHTIIRMFNLIYIINNRI